VSVLLCTVSQFVGSSEPPLILADYWEKIPMVLLLAYVPRVQVTGVTCSRSDCTAVLKYIGVGFGLTAPLEIVRKIVEGQNRQETTNKQDQGTNKKTLAVDVL
jgi:hypothetical protein